MPSLSTLLSLFLDGASYGMILFLIASGLTVTLGIMRIVNLSHCGFAMIGGYAALALVSMGLPLLAALPIAVLFTMAVGFLLEQTIYRVVYRTHEFGQILMTLGLTYLMVATINLLFGSLMQNIPVPEALNGVWLAGGLTISKYRIFLVAVSAGVAVLLWATFEWTMFGARLRAAIDNPRMARASGIDVGRLLSVAFAAGCGLAALGGVLGAQMLPLEPFYALKYLVLVLMVVTVGGLGSLKGSLVAALALGLIDTFGRYFVPEFGGFVIYVTVFAFLLVRPRGLFQNA
ncbi:branched-chain amino acid ABC transporter permease [Neorhizobium petrolearium]|uniref:branched-chain amino acid ABC transporter permease n=1 Tax=Neorhizobium petrolearium TaxID=515361 RepID=UPI003F5CD1DA